MSHVGHSARRTASPPPHERSLPCRMHARARLPAHLSGAPSMGRPRRDLAANPPPAAPRHGARSQTPIAGPRRAARPRVTTRLRDLSRTTSTQPAGPSYRRRPAHCRRSPPRGTHPPSSAPATHRQPRRPLSRLCAPARFMRLARAPPARHDARGHQPRLPCRPRLILSSRCFGKARDSLCGIPPRGRGEPHGMCCAANAPWRQTPPVLPLRARTTRLHDPLSTLGAAVRSAGRLCAQP